MYVMYILYYVLARAYDFNNVLVFTIRIQIEWGYRPLTKNKKIIV